MGSKAVPRLRRSFILLFLFPALRPGLRTVGPTGLARGKLVLRVQLVGFGGHDEIVAMQPTDLVSPPRDRDSPPFGQNGRVMSFPLGELSHSSSKRQSLSKILEAKPPFQPRDSVALGELPLLDLGPQLRDLCLGHLRGIGPARHAFLLCQLRHVSSCRHHPILPAARQMYTAPGVQLKASTPQGVLSTSNRTDPRLCCDRSDSQDR